MIVGAVAAAAFGPPLIVALADLSGSGHRWPDLLAQFSAPATIAALTATLVFALLRLFRTAALGLAVGLLCAQAAAPQVRPVHPAPAPGAPTLRLYSANLYVRNDDVQAMAASIRAARPDIVVLVEAGDAAAGALDLLVADLPHRVASPRRPWRDRGARTVIASRWPLGPMRRERDVLAQTPLGPIELGAVHFTRPWPYQVQWEQVRDVEVYVAESARPGPSRIMAGDFNTVSDARIGRMFARESGLTPAPSFPGTWPAALPGVLGIGIDHVWISRDLTVVERRLGRRNGSDHRPVVTVLSRARP